MLQRYGAPRAIVHLLALIFLAAGSPALARDLLVVAFGDSLSAGYQLRPGQGFAPRLEATLRAQRVPVRVHNAGVSGDTTAAARKRLPWVLNALKAKPDLVIVELGGNDMLRGIPAAQTRANLDAILTELKRRRIRTVVAGMLAAPNMGPRYAAAFNPIYPQLARKHGAELYPFFMRGLVGNRSLLLRDGVHPNAAGVNVIARGISPVVRRALGR